jgi:erythronate-4-phosphate dehydrogenase
MKLITDNKIPHIAAFFTACDEIVYLPGEHIQRAHLMDADLLLVRTVTPVNESLLHGTPIKWVGTATTGTDHVDTAWLSQNQIAFSDAAGANAHAVLDYVWRCVTGLKKRGYLSNNQPVAGIIGVGRIGSLVAHALKADGFDVLCYDPLRADQSDFSFVSLNTLLRESDFITLHTPLTQNGAHPTYHLIDEPQLTGMKKNTVLLNTSRGAVINQIALLNAKNIVACLDVWEHEPQISIELLKRALIATPHIAGYSREAKYRATQMTYNAAATFFGWPENNTPFISEVTNQDYDPFAHTTQFRAAFAGETDPAVIREIFMMERKNYVLR